MIVKEFCAENFTEIPRAIKNGATRIELCDNLAVGGTTPSVGVIEETCKYAKDKQIPVFVMIRPRGGDFVYNDIELRMMEKDMLMAVENGADGLVFGCLTQENELDEEALEFLMPATRGLEVTYHMAFDEIPREKQKEAIDVLKAFGVTRILTHGSDLKRPIMENIDWLEELNEFAKGKLHFLIGGGITHENVAEVVQKTGVLEVHGTKIVKMDENE